MTRFLTIAVALAGLFAVQQAAVAKNKNSTKTSASKKSHKKHKKTGTASTVTPTAKAAPAIS
jgi:hypothetical protein